MWVQNSINQDSNSSIIFMSLMVIYIILLPTYIFQTRPPLPGLHWRPQQGCAR
uniref:Uncharacterized protein n=1 Tax=Arundo donax TaxID=35708 RepID=A0A0A9BH73_ARUDO